MEGLLKSKFLGCMVGAAVGDALGMPLEGLSWREIRKRFGLVREMVDGRLPAGSYTDDTEMMISLAESLVEVGGFNGAHMAGRLHQNVNLWRGYGMDPIVLEWIASGEPWDKASEKLFGGEGSYGNGGAIRVAPVALLYYDQPERLKSFAALSAKITHAHPLGIEGAVIQAYAIAQAVRLNPEEGFDASGFLKGLREVLQSRAFRDKIAVVEGFLARRVEVEEVVGRLGCGVEAFNSVPAALYAFLANPSSFEEAVVYAVNLGGDSDSLGAMTGAIAGAYHGYEAIPKRWIERLERAKYIVELAEKLWRLKASRGKALG
ncbi:MAG: hypothetical protein DRO52_02255 [Candidatus Hecatellales archaeon]|nr:MAG: hypothetical protein DRO52_02255 [Candidatus Hecatellales archaeon]